MTPATTLLSPKDLAAAIGASESSLRRWIDSGEVQISRTAGGHRRIPLPEAVRFIRKLGAVVVRPEILNLPALPATDAASPSEVSDEDRLFAALRDGQGDVARGLVVWWYLQSRPLHELFDGPVRGAMHRVGELWQHDERGILVEHRATEICLGTISTLRALLPAADETSPLAIGAAPAGDPYQVPSLMAATVLGEAGWRELNFGANTPLRLLSAEAIRARARLVWLSISHVADARSLRAEMKSLAAELAERKVELVIGGHASAQSVPRRGGGSGGDVSVIRSMGELAAFARGLRTRKPAKHRV